MQRRQIKKDDIPVFKNGGKVSSTDGEAIDIPEAVKFDDTPVIPKTPPPKKEPVKKKSTDSDKTKRDTVIETQAQKQISKEIFENSLIEIGCILADKLLGERKNLNTNPLPDKQIASIECLLNIYKSIKE